MRSLVYEILMFGFKEARACLFPALFFAVLWVSHYVPLFGLARYDFLFLAALGIQLALLLAKLETKNEVLILSLFHVLGLGLELFKTHPAIGSWSYPEDSVLKLGTVPLYSGFMYAAVASYMCQAWRILHLRLQHYPPSALSVLLSAAIYINFFTHHFIADMRWWLILAVVLVFWRTKVSFVVTTHQRTMPLVLAFGLIGFFIWVAENFATYFGAWAYPEQLITWTIVSMGKINAWFLLVIVSFVLVADLKHVRNNRQLPGSERTCTKHSA